MKKVLVVALSALTLAMAPSCGAATEQKSPAKRHAVKQARHAKGKTHAVAARKKTVAARQRKAVRSHVAVHPAAAKPRVSTLQMSQNLATEPVAVAWPAVVQTVAPVQPVAAAQKVAAVQPVATRSMTEAETAPEAPNLLSNAVLVIDQSTGMPLYAKNPDMQTPIASITKLMTSLVVLDAGQPMNEQITITNEDVDRLKHTSSRLAVGTTLTRGELLHLALIASENRAAAALARNYPGGREACIRAMNRKAALLGMDNTRYVDGTGLNSANQSTAIDLAKLVNVASQNPVIRRITSTGEYGVEVPGRQVVRVRDHGRIRRVSRPVEKRIAFHNTNALTRDPDWEIGLSKTGFINEAGHCLVMQARIGERKVIMVLLDSVGKMSRIGDANRIRHWLEGDAG